MIVGVLLAGGKSERMGEDKGSLVLGTGETMGARALCVLRAVCDEVVCAGHGRGVPADVVRIDDSGNGPLVALAGTLAHVARSHPACAFVVLPVDMPGVDEDLLRRLLAVAEGAVAACFTIEARVEPLPVVLAAAARAALVDAAARGERRLGEAVRALAPATVALSLAQAWQLSNLNTRAEFDAVSGHLPRPR